MRHYNLSGTWKLTSSHLDQTVEAAVPGTVYGALLQAGVINDPYHRDNEYHVREWMRHDYRFERVVELDFQPHHYIELICEGLDTLAQITVNGGRVAATDNMHRAYHINITPYVRKGMNTIGIDFASPIEYIEKRKKQAQYRYFEIGDAMSGYAYLRKAHAMFGWDWGPQLPDAGIYRPIQINVVEYGKIHQFSVRQTHADNQVRLDVKVAVSWVNQPHDIRQYLYDPNGTLLEEMQGERATFTIDNPSLWWPHDEGDQPLYRVVTCLEVAGEVVHSQSKRIGLRTRSWKRDNDEHGQSFTYVHNGVPLFLKGANYIPEDSLLDRVNTARSRQLLNDVKAANHNTIRVWGGGYYPDDAWFDLCDELGILVWQDFMFACAFYELDDAAFMRTVETEITETVIRLEHHASLILFCGNNEIETAILDWNVSEKARSMKKYPTLFETAIPSWVASTGTDVVYWPSSPSSGGQFHHPNGEAAGDMHYWDVWHNEAPIRDYRKIVPRFLSEFGLQSFPALETVERFTEPEDRNIFSYVMESHQKNRSANRKILHYISEMFRYPESFDALLYVSQLIQAEGVRSAVEHLRRHRDRCMGTLYWQLNDCWPVASWSSIDYYGRWKALHFASKRFYEPILLSIEDHPDQAHVHLTNDTAQPLVGTMTLMIQTLKGKPLKTQKRAFRIEPRTTQRLDTINHEMDIADTRAVFVEARCTLLSQTISTVALFVPDKHLALEHPSFKLDVKPQGTKLVLSIESDTLARFVELRHPSARFEDNMFHLVPNQTKHIMIDTHLDAQTWLNTLKIRTLRDTY